MLGSRAGQLTASVLLRPATVLAASPNVLSEALDLSQHVGPPTWRAGSTSGPVYSHFDSSSYRQPGQGSPSTVLASQTGLAVSLATASAPKCVSGFFGTARGAAFRTTQPLAAAAAGAFLPAGRGFATDKLSELEVGVPKEGDAQSEAQPISKPSAEELQPGQLLKVITDQHFIQPV